MRALSTSLWLVTGLVLISSDLSHAKEPSVENSQAVEGSALPPVPQNDAEAYRQVLLETLDVIDQVSLLSGRVESLSTARSISEKIRQLDTQRLQHVAAQAPPLAQLQARLQRSRDLLAQALARPDSGNDVRAIEFPEPETTVAACSLVEPTFAFILFSEWSVIKELLAALRWVCLDEVAGLNSAESCTVESILDTAAELEYEAADACLTEQRDAYLEAILETDENIADYLSDFVDATTSSRASQDSVDDVQSDVTSNQGLLDDLDSSLEDDLTSIEDDLNSALDDLATLSTDITSLTSVIDDIQLRTQENQVDIEDAQTRAANAQSTAEEILSDAQTIISDLDNLQTTLNSLETGVASALSQTSKAALVAVLADPDARVIRYMLPESVGGELEGAREIVVQTLRAFDQIGAKTSTAQALLSQGDLAYNQQNYLIAYQFFAQAYQALLGATPNQPGISR